MLGNIVLHRYAKKKNNNKKNIKKKSNVYVIFILWFYDHIWHLCGALELIQTIQGV